MPTPHHHSDDADRFGRPARANVTPDSLERFPADDSSRVFGLPIDDDPPDGPSHAAHLARALRAGDQVDTLTAAADAVQPPPRGGAPYVTHEELIVLWVINAYGVLLQALIALVGPRWLRERAVAEITKSLIAKGLVFPSRGRTHHRGRGPLFLQLTNLGHKAVKDRFRILGVDYRDITAPPEKVASGLRYAPTVSRMCGHDQHVAAITLLIRQKMHISFTGNWHTPLWPHGRFEPPRKLEWAGPRQHSRSAEIRDMPNISGLRYVPAGDESSFSMDLRKVSPDSGLLLDLETEPGGSLIESHLLIEYQQDNSFSKLRMKLLNYEALLTGWYPMLERFEEQRNSRPVVFWVCRTRDHALRAAATADEVLAGGLLDKHVMTSRPRLACPARHQFIFAAETDVLAGHFVGWKLPPWPPGHPYRDPDSGFTRVRLFRSEP